MFETSPVYRGRKLEKHLSLHFIFKMFETSPVYRGRKLLISMLSNNELTRMFETSPVYRGRKPNKTNIIYIIFIFFV